MTNKSYLNCVRRLGDIPNFVKNAVSEMKYQKRVFDLRKRGAVPFNEKSFEKISWDIFRKTVEPDAGSIWVKETIKNANGEDEAWLVVYTDGDNDRIVRQVKASNKTAQEEEKEDKDLKIAEKLLENKKFKIVGLDEFTADEFVMTDEEYQELLKHNNQLALVDVIAVWNGDIESAYVDVTFDDEYYIAALSTYHLDRIDELEEAFDRLKAFSKKTSSKTSHFPGTIVQIDVPHGNLYEKYNGKIGEVVAAVPDRSKVSFKDLPSTWFEDNIIRPVSLCPICNAKMSLQMLKKLGTLKCKCGASYSKRQLEKIANENRINKVAAEKIRKTAVEYDIEDSEALDNGWTILYEQRDSDTDYKRVRVFDTETSSHWKILATGYGVWDYEDYVEEVKKWSPPSFKKREKEVTNPEWLELLDISANRIEKLIDEGYDPDEAYQIFMKEIRKKRKITPYFFSDVFDEPEHRALLVRTLKERGIEISSKVASKKAQNVVQTLWVDDPKDLRHYFKSLQSPPTSPAKEPSKEEPEDLEEVELEPKEEEVEKEASIKKSSKPAREWLRLIHEAWDDFDELLEVLDGLQTDYKEELDKIEKSPEREKTYRSGKLLDLINYVEKHLGKLSSIASIKKEADSMEALRGGGGAGSDKLTPMNWTIQKSKTPKLPAKPEEEKEPETEEEVEEITIIVNPDSKAVSVDFGKEEAEEEETKVGEPKGAEAPVEGTEEPETEEVEEEEVGEGSAEKKSEPATSVVF